MRKSAIAGFMLAATLATPAFSQALVGQWTATAHVQDTDVSEKLTVTKSGDGYAIGSKAVAAQEGAPEAGPATNVKLDGNNFSYTRSLDLGGNKIDIVYRGTVSGDTFTGTAEVGDTKIPYTGVRAK
jgi:hypothetical protein